MRALLMLAVAGLATSTVALAKEPQSRAANAKLAKALDAAISTNSTSSQSSAAKDAGHPGKGNENASQRAIDVVCSKDTPAARRAAICEPPPVSPE